jgi:hypothetical protein
MKKKHFPVYRLLVIAFLLFQTVALRSQEVTSDLKSLADRISRALNQSDIIQHLYSWESRVDVTRDGKIMDVLIQSYKYGPDGNVIKTVLNDEHANLPSSFLIHEIAEDEKTKLVNFLNGVHEFLLHYNLKTEDQILSFFGKAKVIPAEPGSQILASGDDVLQPGDKMTWWISPDSFTTTKLNVITTFSGDQIEFTASFNTIPGGLNYISFAEIIIPAKNLMLQLHTYDYTRVE